MKRLETIRVTMVMAVVSLLAATTLPHHHHFGDVAAIVINSFTADNDGDCHPHHEGDFSSCIEEESFDVAKCQTAPQPATTILPAAAEPVDCPTITTSRHASFPLPDQDDVTPQSNGPRHPLRRGPPAV